MSVFRSFLIISICIAAGSCTGILPEMDEGTTTQRLLENFDHIIFKDEYDENRQIGRIRKWTKPLRIAVVGHQAGKYHPVVTRHAKTLQSLIGLPVTVLNGPDGTENITVHAVPWDDIEAIVKPYSPRPDWLKTIIEESSCLFLFRYNKLFEIQSAIIAISTNERFDLNASCLLEEMTQALGMPNDSEKIRPSLFNGHDNLMFPTVGDMILIRTLYDKRIKPNMPRAQALIIAQRIIDEQSVEISNLYPMSQ